MNTTTMELAWIIGSSVGEAIASSTVMGAVGRTRATTDEERKRIYIVGGNGRGFSSTGYLQDVWIFDTENDEFVEYVGAGEDDQIADFESIPQQIGSLRYHCASDKLIDGLIYVFGGDAHIMSSSSNDVHNQLWTFNVSSKTWAHISGSSDIHIGSNRAGTNHSSPTHFIEQNLRNHRCSCILYRLIHKNEDF